MKNLKSFSIENKFNKAYCYFCKKEIKEGKSGKAVVGKNATASIAHWFCFKGQSK